MRKIWPWNEDNQDFSQLKKRQNNTCGAFPICHEVLHRRGLVGTCGSGRQVRPVTCFIASSNRHASLTLHLVAAAHCPKFVGTVPLGPLFSYSRSPTLAADSTFLYLQLKMAVIAKIIQISNQLYIWLQGLGSPLCNSCG